MSAAALAAALLLLQQPGGPPRDTLRIGRDTIRIGAAEPAAAPMPAAALPDSIFDTPGTRALVERVIRAGSAVPPELADYTARMRSTVYLSLRADTAQGGEIPVTIDEFAGEVRWDRAGSVEQRLLGHQIRLLAPTPYTVGSMVEAPWIIPHLYGNTITVFSLAATPGARARASRAVHPFSWRGVDFYRYETGDTVRVRTQQGTVTLVPVRVTPRAGALRSTEQQLVAGSFSVDVDRAAVTRARFGFVERRGGFLVAETAVYFELENGLVANRYWLPYRQRREIQISSPLLGGATAIRLVTTLSRFEVNTGWRPEEPGARLVWALARRGDPFADLAGTEEDAPPDIGDFADLRSAIRPPEGDAGPISLALRWERSEHLFRYNRVEGAFLGVAARAEPRDPERRTWDAYATAGWAFAEGTPRGELSLRWHPRPPEPGAPEWTLAGTGYRRLRDTRTFRPVFEWELGYALGAALGGWDRRDYYDAAGVELALTRRTGPFRAQLAGRWERQDSVSLNTDRFLFGEAEDFPPLAPADPGDHAAVEGELRWQRGAGAFGIVNSTVASLRGEAGFGDFRTQRVTALLSARRGGRYLTLIGRLDGGMVAGEAPPQFLFRFGGREGLRGYADREFGGSQAWLARGRLLVHLPPYGRSPLFRTGFFVFPPLRPAVVLSGDAGWSDVSDESAGALFRLGSRVTDGVRSSYGVGLSVFEDALSLEYVWPGEGGKGKWYAGFATSF